MIGLSPIRQSIKIATKTRKLRAQCRAPCLLKWKIRDTGMKHGFFCHEAARRCGGKISRAFLLIISARTVPGSCQTGLYRPGKNWPALKNITGVLTPVFLLLLFPGLLIPLLYLFQILSLTSSLPFLLLSLPFLHLLIVNPGSA